MGASPRGLPMKWKIAKLLGDLVRGKLSKGEIARTEKNNVRIGLQQ
jgi:hypothetical protein